MQNVANWKVNFGKYQGWTFANMIKEDPAYAKWFLSITTSPRVQVYLAHALVERPVKAVTDVQP